MNESMEFELIPEKIPKIKKKASRYDPIIDQFVDSNLDSVWVNTKDMEPKKLAIALRTRVRARDIMNVISVSQRGDKVYLIKVGK